MNLLFFDEVPFAKTKSSGRETEREREREGQREARADTHTVIQLQQRPSKRVWRSLLMHSYNKHVVE